MASENVIAVSEATFEQEVVGSAVPVLVDFWAPWCGPCRIVAPTLEQLAGEMKGKVRVAKVNVDDNPALAARFGIQSIPTFLVFKGGSVVNRTVGALQKSQFQSLLQGHLA